MGTDGGHLYDLMVPIDIHDVFWAVVRISARSFDPPRRGGNGSCIMRTGTSSVCFGFGLRYVGVEDVGRYGHGGGEEAYVFVYRFSLIQWKEGRVDAADEPHLGLQCSLSSLFT